MRPGRAEHAAAFTAREGATVSRAMLSRAIANLPAAYPGTGLRGTPFISRMGPAVRACPRHRRHRLGSKTRMLAHVPR
jgi:hypothetical protein